MEHKQVALVSAVVFGLIALLHLVRILTQFEAVIAGWEVPLWLNGIAIIIAGWLCWENWRVQKK